MLQHRKSKKKDDTDKLSEANSFSGNMQSTMSDLSKWMTDNPIKAPGLDTSSWEKMVTDAESYSQRISNAASAATTALSNGVFTVGFNSGNSENAQKLINEALKWQGTPYKWGGTTKAGADCSGFLQTVAQTALGKSIPRTTYTQFGSSAGKIITNKSDLQAGDYIYFGKSGSQPSHVAMYLGDNKYIHAPRTGDVIKISEWTRSDFIGGMRFWATGTKDFDTFGSKPNGIAGENYRKETLINKKTGDMTVIDEPTFVDTREYDVVGEKQTAKVLSNKHATGTPTTDAEILSYIKKASEATGVPANIIMAVMDKETGYKWYGGIQDGKYKSYGYMMMNEGGGLAWLKSIGRSDLASAAKTDKYSNVLGAAMLLSNLYKTNGSNWQRALVRYNGSGSAAEAYGKNVWQTANSSAFINAANALSGISAYTQQTASNTQATANYSQQTAQNTRFDFEAQLKNLVNNTDSASVEKWQGSLLDYIRNNIDLSSDNNEAFIDKWSKLQQYQNEQADVFKWYDKQLLEAVGTDGFIPMRKELSQAADKYSTAIMAMSADLNIAQIKTSFAQANEILQSILAYYNKRKSEGANADELKTITDAYNTQQETVNSLSDSYVSQMKAQTDYLVSLAEREMQSYSDRLTWLRDENEELEKQENLSRDIASTTDVTLKRLENYNRQMSMYQDIQKAAHQGVLDLYDNESYMPVFKRFDLESWFDAEGNATAQFANDVERMSLTLPEIVPIMQQIFNQVQTFKKAWYEAEDAVIECKNAIRDIQWTAFDDLQEKISGITDESDFFIDLLDKNKSYDENGNLTRIGQAIRGLHGVNYNVYQQQAQKYADFIKEIDGKMAANPESRYNEELIERRQKLLELQRQSILAAKDEKDALIDLVQEGFNAQINAMGNLISNYKDALRAEKDLHDYRKSIETKTKDIASIEKQLAAYENDTSEETRATVQKLKKQLEESQEDLQDMQYEQYIKDQEAMLDSFYEGYKAIFEAKMDDTTQLIDDVLADINKNSNQINSTVSKAAKNAGIEVSSEMHTIWTGAQSVVSEYKNNFALHTTNIISAINDVTKAVDSLIHYVTKDYSESSTDSTSNTSYLRPMLPTATVKQVITDADGHQTVITGDGDVQITYGSKDNKAITVGGQINAENAQIYATPNGKAMSQYFKNHPIYTVIGENGDYVQVRHISATGGSSGWFKKSDVKAYKDGGLIDYTGMAWVDGTPDKPEAILSAKDTENIRDLAEGVSELPDGVIIRPDGAILTPLKRENIGSNLAKVTTAMTDFANNPNDFAKKLTEGFNIGGSASVIKQGDTFTGDINVELSFPNVQDYEGIRNEMAHDVHFERLIHSMTIDRLAGGSKLKKYKY